MRAFEHSCELLVRPSSYCLHIIRLHVPSELKMNKTQLKTSPNPPNKQTEQRSLQRTCSYGWFCYGVLLSPTYTVQLWLQAIRASCRVELRGWYSKLVCVCRVLWGDGQVARQPLQWKIHQNNYELVQPGPERNTVKGRRWAIRRVRR